MIKIKIFSPFLLINLIFTILQFVLCCGFVTLIIINQQTGFLQYTFTTCQVSTNKKFQNYVVQIQKAQAILNIINTIAFLCQLVLLVLKYLKYKKQFQSVTKDIQDKNFQQITKKMVIILFVTNVVICLILFLILGFSLAYFLQYSKCSVNQNKQLNYILLIVISGINSLIQIGIILILLKFLCNFQNNQIKLNKNLSENQQTPRFKQQISKLRDSLIMGNEEIHTNHDKINQLSPKKQNYQNNNKPYSTVSTQNDQKFQKQQEITLLNKKQRQTPYQNNKKNKDKNQSKNKQMLKKMIRYPYNNKNDNLNRVNTIFQQQQQIDSQSQQSQILKKSFLNNNVNHLENLKQQNKNKTNSNSKKKNTNLAQNDNKNNKNNKFQNKQRFKLKQSTLSIQSNVYEFDSLNYQITQNQDNSEKQSQQQQPNINRKRINTKRNAQITSLNCPSELKNANSKLQSKQKQKDQKSKYKKNNKFSPQNQINQNNKNRMRKNNQKIDSNIQTQHPFMNLLNQDQQYQDKYQKIIQFERLYARKRNPYVKTDLDDIIENNQGKLYMHKTRYALNKVELNQEDFIDPFHNDDSWIQNENSNRQLEFEKNQSGFTNTSYKHIPNNETKKQNKQYDINQLTQTKKNSKKDGLLLDFIRSRYVID